MHAAARVRGRRGEKEAADRQHRPAEAGEGPKDERLVELRGAAAERAADEAPVACFQI
jgi:hypothetical protein